MAHHHSHTVRSWELPCQCHCSHEYAAVCAAIKIRRAWVEKGVVLPGLETANRLMDAIYELRPPLAATSFSEHQSGASQNTGGQPKAGGLQNRECLGVMDDPEHATGEKI